MEKDGDLYDAGVALRPLCERLDNVKNDSVQMSKSAAGDNFAMFSGKSKSIFEEHEPEPAAGMMNPNRWMHEVPC